MCVCVCVCVCVYACVCVRVCVFALPLLFSSVVCLQHPHQKKKKREEKKKKTPKDTSDGLSADRECKRPEEEAEVEGTAHLDNGRAQLRVAHGPDETHDAAQQPDDERASGRPRLQQHAFGRHKDAAAHDDAHDDAHAVGQPQVLLQAHPFLGDHHRRPGRGEGQGVGGGAVGGGDLPHPQSSL